MTAPEDALKLLEHMKKHVEALESALMVCDFIIEGSWISIPSSKALESKIKEIVRQRYLDEQRGETRKEG